MRHQSDNMYKDLVVNIANFGSPIIRSKHPQGGRRSHRDHIHPRVDHLSTSQQELGVQTPTPFLSHFHNSNSITTHLHPPLSLSWFLRGRGRQVQHNKTATIMGSTRGALAGKTSLYVSRLRRAFLLQVHPDRFRSHSDAVRKQQANLVQGLCFVHMNQCCLTMPWTLTEQ